MRYLILILMMAFFTLEAAAQQSLTLEEAIQIALQRNPTVNKAENNLGSYESSVQASYGALLPSLGASAGWSWSRNEEAGGPVDIGGGTIINIPTQTSQNRQYTAGVGGSVTLFDGLANYTQVSIAEDSYEAAKMYLARTKQDIVYQTVSSYYDVINKLELMTVQQENLKWNQKNLEIIEARNELGAVTMADVYQQQVDVGTAELGLIRAQNAYETSKSNLLYFLGLDVMEDYELKDPKLSSENLENTNMTLEIDDDLYTLVDAAFENRADYRMSMIELHNAKRRISTAWAGHLPSLTSSYYYSMRGNQIGNITDSKTLSVSLDLRVPIFSGWSVADRVEQNTILKRNAEIDLSDFERQIKKDLQKSLLDLQSAEKNVEVSRKSVMAAEEKRKIEEEKYNLGSTTLLEVLIANSNYTRALTEYINAQYNFLTLREKLNYDLGTLEYTSYEK